MTTGPSRRDDGSGARRRMQEARDLLRHDISNSLKSEMMVVSRVIMHENAFNDPSLDPTRGAKSFKKARFRRALCFCKSALKIACKLVRVRMSPTSRLLMSFARVSRSLSPSKKPTCALTYPSAQAASGQGWWEYRTNPDQRRVYYLDKFVDKFEVFIRAKCRKIFKIANAKRFYSFSDPFEDADEFSIDLSKFQKNWYFKFIDCLCGCFRPSFNLNAVLRTRGKVIQSGGRASAAE